MNDHARRLFAWQAHERFPALARARFCRDAALAALDEHGPALWRGDDRRAQHGVLAHLGENSGGDAAAGAVPVVIGGQQPVLAGGPLMILAKLATIIAESRARQRQGPTTRVLPLFWVAAEDHDFDEVRRLRFPDAHVELAPDHGVRRGAESRRLDQAQALRLRDDLQAALGRGFAQVEDLVTAYLDGARESLSRGFAAFYRALLGESAPRFIEPRDLRPHSAAFFARYWRRRREYQGALEDSARLLRQAGFEAPIAPRAERMPFYLLENGVRAPVMRLGDDRYLVGDRFSGATAREIAAPALGEHLEARPETVSPDALLRFVWQNALLPVALTIGGPAEYAYWLQATRAARVLEVPVPQARLRLSLSIGDGRESFAALQETARKGTPGSSDAERDDDMRRADLAFDRCWRESTRVLARSMPTAPEILAHARARLSRHQDDLRQRCQGTRLADARRSLQGVVLDGAELRERSLPLLWLLARHDRARLLAAVMHAAECAEEGDHMLVELP